MEQGACFFIQINYEGIFNNKKIIIIDIYTLKWNMAHGFLFFIFFMGAWLGFLGTRSYNYRTLTTNENCPCNVFMCVCAKMHLFRESTEITVNLLEVSDAGPDLLMSCSSGSPRLGEECPTLRPLIKNKNKIYKNRFSNLIGLFWNNLLY